MFRKLAQLPSSDKGMKPTLLVPLDGATLYPSTTYGPETVGFIFELMPEAEPAFETSCFNLNTGR
jgi:hypothetical protein